MEQRKIYKTINMENKKQQIREWAKKGMNIIQIRRRFPEFSFTQILEICNNKSDKLTKSK